MGYFSRPGHVGMLVGVSFFTYGLGGLVYWLARRKHAICPRCGLGWHLASLELTSGETQDGARLRPPASEVGESLPSGGTKRQVLGVLLVLFATFLIVVGFAEFEAAMVVLGSLTGAAGSGAYFWGWRAKQERRQAMIAGLQRQVLRLATRKGGTLTVTEVAADLNLSIPAAEKVLIAMDDGFRVRSEITPEGILLYEFPEVQHRHRLEPGV